VPVVKSGFDRRLSDAAGDWSPIQEKTASELPAEDSYPALEVLLVFQVFSEH
jgi:hypothetical protein